MSTRKAKKGKGPRVVRQAAAVPRGTEQALRDISKLLEGRDFNSIEEANVFLQQVLAEGGPPAVADPSPLEQAQEVMYQAWEATGRQRLKLARQALALSEDCADAYVLLAEEANSPHDAKALYEQGVAAGERALGPEVFVEDVGHFWGILETRPYMRARAGLAECLWLLGHQEEAISHFQELLRLNPGDNQGIRYLLVNRLLERNDDTALRQLLEQYEDEATASWAYSRALWTFRREGAGPLANEALKQAVEMNPHVPRFLLSKKRLPKKLPPYVGFGDESEAAYYATQGLKVWRLTPGALEWLAQET